MKKRHIIYICLLLMVFFGFGGFGATPITAPVLPTIQLPGEVLIPWESAFMRQYFGHGFTNTMLATIVTWIIVVAIIWSLRARSKTADEIPTGFYNFFEWITEGAYGFVEGSAGKWVKNFFPFFMTFTLFILIANWLELFPGVDSIGIWEDLGHHRVELAEEAAEAEGHHLTEEEIHAIEEEALNDGGARNGPFLVRAEAGEAGQQIVPFLRVSATDLNFTVALAIVSVVMTQVYGVRALGPGYFKKFFNWNADKIARNPLGLMDFVVGLLELISEIGKILSFAFRLFGNIFAGQVLLFVVGAFLVPFAYLAVAGFEFAIHLIQALIFAVLTLTFMAGAIVSHHDDEHH